MWTLHDLEDGVCFAVMVALLWAVFRAWMA